jgi:4-hydroxy-3-polyprenylbenzoate decarboxylase
LTVDAFIKKIGTIFWTQHVGDVCTKVIVVGEDIDPADPGLVTWAFATRNHPTLGAYYFPEMEKFGSGLETYHSVAELVHGKGGLVIYSCLPLQERIGHPAKPIMSFEANYPEALKKRVRSNWARWGFETAKSA